MVGVQALRRERRGKGRAADASGAFVHASPCAMATSACMQARTRTRARMLLPPSAELPAATRRPQPWRQRVRLTSTASWPLRNTLAPSSHTRVRGSASAALRYASSIRRTTPTPPLRGGGGVKRGATTTQRSFAAWLKPLSCSTCTRQRVHVSNTRRPLSAQHAQQIHQHTRRCHTRDCRTAHTFMLT